MFHWQILFGLFGGLTEIFLRSSEQSLSWTELAGFVVCVIGTCAVFYAFFLCRMLGAGDIKLMALCTGILGIWDGLFVIFLGLFLAAARGAFLLCSKGVLWERLERFSGFVIQWGRDGKLREYPEESRMEYGLRLGPYLFLGYCMWLAGRFM